jgi:glycosyltransferase involved in cell wall biosynthesis
MRIVYTVLNGRLAGGQAVCGQMMLAARAAGHQVCLVTPSHGEFIEMCESKAVPIVQLPMARTFHFHRAWQFARFLRAWRADVVHCHAAVTGAILARLGARLAGVPMISHVHIENKFSDMRWICAAQVWLYNFTARFTDEIVAISEHTGRSLISQGLSSQKIRVIRNGVVGIGDAKDNLADRARNKLGIEGDGPVVGTVARLCPVKGQRELILAAHQVRNEFPEAKFDIIGEDIESDGNYRHELERLSEQLGLDGYVQFVGFRPDAARLMYAFDLFVLPSWIEGLPVTILEAMAAGKPVVATSVGGVPELLLDGVTGLLVPPHDPARLAQAITKLLQQPEVARRMGECGRERVRKHFSQKKMLDDVLALYKLYENATPSTTDDTN